MEKNKRIELKIVLIALMVCSCLMSALVILLPAKNANAITDTDLTYKTNFIDLGNLLVENYGDREKIFNGDTLNELFGYLTGQKNATIDDVKNAGTKDSAYFRSTQLNSGNKNLVVTIGGLAWNVVYLSNTKQDGSGDVILTLWLANSTQLGENYSKVQWNYYATNPTAGDYPSNMYGTSMIRSLTLNNGGTYYESISGSNPHVITPEENNPFAIYTMPKTQSGKLKGSIYEFIETPSAMSWQATLSAYETGVYPYNSSNDSYIPDPSSSHYKETKYNYYQNDGYSDWQNDKIWLPALAETGYSNSISGLWNTDNIQRSDSTGNNSSGAYTWLRTARYDGYSTVPILTADGTNYDGDHVNSSEALRPAFHLNLTRAMSSATIPTPQTKGDVKKYYSENGYATFELDKVFTSVMDIVEITASGVNGEAITSIPSFSVAAGVLAFNANEVAEYTVKVKPKDGQYWSDGTADEKQYVYKLKYHVAMLELDISNPDNVVYNGEYQYLPLRYYDANLVSVVINNADALEEKDGVHCIKVLEAKTYTARVELIDKNLMEWNDNDGTEVRSSLSVNVKQKTLSITSNEMWQTDVRTPKEYTLVLDGVCAADIDKLSFDGYYVDLVGNESKVNTNPTLNSDNTQIIVTLPSVETIGSGYKYILRLNESNQTNKNYAMQFEKTFTAEKKSIEFKADEIKWKYGNSKINGGTFITDIELNDDGILELSYNGAEYIFEVDLTDIYNDGSGRFDLIETQLTGDIKATDANSSGYNTVVFKIASIDESIELKGSTTFELNWKINKAKYDLNDVVWARVNSSNVYNKSYHEVYLKGLPETLQVTYGGDYRRMDANDSYKATIRQIANSDSNYETPSITDASTYIYNDGQVFPWEYIWDIKKAGITLTWQSKLAQDINGKDFEYFIVGGEHADKIAGYEYYNDDDYDMTNGAIGESIAFEDITVQSPIIVSYWVVAILDDESAKNYEITGNAARYFSIGSDKIEVSVELNGGDYEFVYDGDTHGDELTVGVRNLSVSDLVLKYYEVGDSENYSANAPSNAGEYWIEIELKQEYQRDYDLIRTRIDFEITKAEVIVENNADTLYYNTEEQGLNLSVTSQNLAVVDILIKYYKSNGEELDGAPINAGEYYALLSLNSEHDVNYNLNVSRFEMKINKSTLELEASIEDITYDGQGHGIEISVKDDKIAKEQIIKTYYKEAILTENKLSSEELPINAGKYIIVFSLSEQDEINYEIVDGAEFEFYISKIGIIAVWNTNESVPILSNLDESLKEMVGYIYYDADGNQIDDGAELEVGKTYRVKAILKGDFADNYQFVDEYGEIVDNYTAETQEVEFELKDKNNGSNVGINSGVPSNPNQPINTSNILDAIKDNWQPIVALISVVLILAFVGKGIGYASKRKKIKNTIDKKYGAYYAISGIGLFGMANTTWTILACILAGVAVLAIVFMILEKNLLNKVLEELEDAKTEFERNQRELENKRRDEQMQMMLMGMLGGNSGGNGGMAQGPYVVQQALGAEEIRSIVADTMTAMLPNTQQALPQQASSNDEVVLRILEKTEKNDETIKRLVKRLDEKPVEKIIEREVATSTVENETIQALVEGQKLIMQRLEELTANQAQGPQPQIVEKIVEVPIEVEKVVEKEVIKEVPVEVEKIIEKEVKVEVPVEVEKVVEKEVVKEVKVPTTAPTPAKPKKETAPRLTLDEAYALLPKQQQKYFDGLREYALSKDKAKEKKSTYNIVIGQSSVNPLMKLTIKKGKTVALFKMEDEYLKDIKRDATSDGTKVKVKETEVVIADAQSCKVAKNMIDLREDQIERYQELLKEQRALSKKK